MLGAPARYGADLTLPTPPDGLPLATFLVNISGCLLIGVLLVTIIEVRQAHPLVRPFLASGVLGGYTTFSTYAVETHGLLRGGHVATGVAYFAGTLVAALVATWAGVRLARAAAGLGR